MSEPRKLYTGSASGGLDQEQYEAARRRAQQLAEQNARRRSSKKISVTWGTFSPIWRSSSALAYTSATGP